MSDWKLVYEAGEIVLGQTLSGVGLEYPPQVESPDIEDDDVPLPRSDGMAMGEDFLAGTSIALALECRSDGGLSAADVLNGLRLWWRDARVRSTAGAVMELRSPDGRSAFGRPREFTPNREAELFGVIGVDATFKCVSDLWFGPERVSAVSLVPPLGQGLVEPLVEPLSIAGGSVSEGSLVVGGSVPAWPVFTFRGPIINPSVWTPMWELQLGVTLAWDDVLVVDTRPWVRSMRLNGMPAAGLLTAGSAWLEDLSIPPGSYQAQLRGVDPTGTAVVEVAVRDAFASY